MTPSPQDRIEQIDAMRQGVEYRFPVTLRGFAIMMRPLSMGETLQVASRVVERMQMAPKEQMHRMTEHTFLAGETLVLASTTDVGTNDPRLTELIIQRMTPDELQSMFKQYVAGCDRCNPSLELLKPEEVRAMAAELKKNSPGPEELASLLIGQSLLHLASLTHFLLSQGD